MAITCTPTALQQNSACYCGQEDLQIAEITYLISILAGGSQVPSVIAAAGKAWIGLDDHFLLADQAYLLAVLAGTGTNAGTLAQAAACYCFPDDLMRAADIYLLSQAASVAAKDLAKNAACFCFDRKTQLALQTYLLAVAAGGSTDPGAISKLAAAAGFIGLDEDTIGRIWVYCACAWAQKKSPSVDPANDWAARVVTNGGSAPAASTVSALRTFYNALVTAGIDGKMIAVNCVVPDSLIAACTPLICKFGNTLWTPINFVAGDLTVSGLKGDNIIGRYMKTGVIPSQCFASTSDCGGSVIVVTNTDDAGDQWQMGAVIGAAQTYNLYLQDDIGGFQSYNTTTGFIFVDFAQSGPGIKGFISGSRTDSTHEFLYQGGGGNAFSQVAGPGGAPGASLPTVETYVWATNANGFPGQYAKERIAFVAIHNGLTQAQTLSFFNAAYAMRQALGGGNV